MNTNVDNNTNLTNFNSIKVRLELGYWLRPIFSISYFNSIKVRLELGGALGVASSLLFQFHKGAIRTRRNISKHRSLVISIP